MSVITHRIVETNGIRMHVAEAGTGPLVLLLHGWPELWYSWRHQLVALADAGYHAVAPDQRGYGQTDRPAEIDKYNQLHLVGDVVGLLDALHEEQAVIVGHDWGAPVAWNTAVMRPDRVRGVVGLSVPYAPRGSMSLLSALRLQLGDGFYMSYFQQPGVADAELERDVRRSLRMIYFSISGDAPVPSGPAQPVIPPGKGFLDILLDPETLPSWLGEDEIDYYTHEFERTGFAGGLNWYRTIDTSWDLTAPWAGAVVRPPVLYIAGERDLVLAFPAIKELIADQNTVVKDLRGTHLLPGCGHWTQEERPDDVNRLLLEFLDDLAPSS